MSQAQPYAPELKLFRDTLASGETPTVITELTLNGRQSIVTGAKPQQARHLGELLRIIATGKKPSSSGKTTQDAIGWEPVGSFGRKFDGYRGVIQFSLSSGTGEKKVEISTANGTRDEFLEDLVDTQNISKEFFAMGLKVVGELVMFNSKGEEMGCVGFEKGKAIIRFARKYINGISPVKFGIRVFKFHELGTLSGDSISDGQLKEKFMRSVFKDSTCIEVIMTTTFEVGRESGAVFIDGRTVVDDYSKFPEFLNGEAAKRGIEGYVVSFPPSWLHFDNSSSPTTPDYNGVARLKSACKAKPGFTLNLFAERKADGSVSLYEQVLKPPVCTLTEPYMCLVKFPAVGVKVLVRVRCTWIRLKYEKTRPLLDMPWKREVNGAQLVGVHQITEDDVCPPGSMSSDIAVYAGRNKYLESIDNAIWIAMKDAREMGMYTANGELATAKPDASKYSLISKKHPEWPKYPTLSSAKAGPTTFKFGPGPGSEGSGGSSGALITCKFSCRCSELKRKTGETAKMFTGKKCFVWPAGYKQGDSLVGHLEDNFVQGDGTLIDPVNDKSCDFAVVPSEETPTTKSFVKWYASLEGDKPTVILSHWLCNCNFLNTLAPSLVRATVEVPEVFAIEDVYEVGKPLSSWGKKAYVPPDVCKCPPPKHKRVEFKTRPGEDPTKCKTCLLTKVIVDPQAKKQKIFSEFDHQVIHVWGGDDAIKVKVTEFKGIVYTPDHDRCDFVLVNDEAMAVSGDMLKWLARFAVLPLIFKIEGLDHCIANQLSKPPASFELTSRV
jgi:hypothetical protein